MFDRLKATIGLGTDRPTPLRQAIMCCRKGGTVSVPAVYNFVDQMPMGAFINKSLTMKTGQTHVHRYLKPLMERIQKGEIDPAAIITHRLPLAEAPTGYQKFRDKQDGCVKVVLTP